MHPVNLCHALSVQAILHYLTPIIICITESSIECLLTYHQFPVLHFQVEHDSLTFNKFSKISGSYIIFYSWKPKNQFVQMTVDYFVLEVNVNLDMYDDNELFDVLIQGQRHDI